MSAVWANGAFISCSVDEVRAKNRCTVYRDSDGEVLADGLFTLDGRAARKDELRYLHYSAFYLQRGIELEDSRTLVMEEAGERDPTNRLIDTKLQSLSSSKAQRAIDCGTTTLQDPKEQVSQCAQKAFDDHKSFYVRYSLQGEMPYISYGLAGDTGGNAFQVLYDMRGLLNFGLGENEQAFDDNHLRVTTCIRPVSLIKTQEGPLACAIPVNEKESALAAQQKPIEATVCAVVDNPAAFNNKMVRIHGHVSGNFEYSLLDGDGCSGSIWFAYGGGAGPPGLIANVMGGAVPGARDSEGRTILPVPSQLIRDFRFGRFQRLMKARVRADLLSEKRNPGAIVFSRVTATFVGRIDAVSQDVHEFHLKRQPEDRADFLGFGQMGLFDAQFVLQSVESDSVLDIEPPHPPS